MPHIRVDIPAFFSSSSSKNMHPERYTSTRAHMYAYTVRRNKVNTSVHEYPLSYESANTKDCGFNNGGGRTSVPGQQGSPFLNCF